MNTPLTKYPVLMMDETYHNAINAVMASNNWDYAFSAGYVSGLFDAFEKRKREHNTADNDDYAKGYHRGFSETLT